MLDSSALSEAIRAKSLELLHLNIRLVGQFSRAVLALLCHILFGPLARFGVRVANRPVGGGSPASLCSPLGVLALNVVRLCVTWAFCILAILVVPHMHGVLFALHALEVVSFSLKLIVIIFCLWLTLILRSLLLSVITSTHIGIMHVLYAPIRHIRLCPGSISPLLVLRILLYPVFLSSVIQFALGAHLLAVAIINKLAHAAVTDVHLLLVVVRCAL